MEKNNVRQPRENPSHRVLDLNEPGINRLEEKCCKQHIYKHRWLASFGRPARWEGELALRKHRSLQSNTKIKRSKPQQLVNEEYKVPGAKKLGSRTENWKKDLGYLVFDLSTRDLWNQGVTGTRAMSTEGEKENQSYSTSQEEQNVVVEVKLRNQKNKLLRDSSGNKNKTQWSSNPSSTQFYRSTVKHTRLKWTVRRLSFR